MGTEDEEPRLGLISAIGSQDSYLAVVSTLRSDGTPHSSLVNAAVVAHPMAGAQVGAFVTYGPVKLAHLRRRPAPTRADIGEGRDTPWPLSGLQANSSHISLGVGTYAHLN